jgi:phosphatidylinositol-3,4,5-trisphosphate 3-phosphatase/dual-specificity protein phosphatase PTEN
MSFPASGVEGIYRNNIDAVADLLNAKHKESFMVFNLCDRTYDSQALNQRVKDFGFPDHHGPPLMLFMRILLAIDDWLRENDKHVAVVHCLAGRGRTGTVVASYLYFAGIFNNVDHALKYYAQKRSDKEQGVTQPSQLRYARYLPRLLDEGIVPRPKTLRLNWVKFGPIPAVSSQYGIRPLIYIFNYTKNKINDDIIYFSENSKDKVKHYRKDDGLISIDTAGVELKGDIVIKLYHLSSNLFGVPKQTEVSRLIFHTGFVPADQSVMSFTRKDLDGAYKDNRFPDDFELRLHYTVVNDPKEGETDDFWDEDLLEQFVQRSEENRNKTKPIDKSVLTTSDLSSSLTDFTVVKEFEESLWVDDEPDLNSSNVVQQLMGSGEENNNNTNASTAELIDSSEVPQDNAEQEKQ